MQLNCAREIKQIEIFSRFIRHTWEASVAQSYTLMVESFGDIKNYKPEVQHYNPTILSHKRDLGPIHCKQGKKRYL